MPQLILEYSSNVIEKNNLNNLFQECHSLLEKMLPTDISSCKSRSIERQNYYVGNGEPNNAFVHISLKIMPGRTPDTLKDIGDNIMAILKRYFEKSFENLNLQVTLEIMELQKTYFKVASC